jgi:hypothetical protein
MASPNARLAVLQEHQTYQVVPPKLQQSWIRHLQKLGDRSTRPVDGEEFAGPEDCLQRLNDWAFLEGAVYVTAKVNNGPTDDTPNWLYACDAYGTKTANKQKLQESRVRRDEEGEVVSDRKRDRRHRR